MGVTFGRVLDAKTKERVERELAKGGVDWRSSGFRALLLGFLLFALLLILFLLEEVLTDGVPLLFDRLGSFLSAGTRTQAGETGIFQAMRGTFWIGVFVVVFAFPIGVGAAIYLQEYAKDTRFTRFVDTNIRNLAGVPSVVYGILGFTIFVKVFDGFFGDAERHNGRTTTAAGLTLAVLVLPIVIITAAEAIRAVPTALREGGFGVGATKWQVIRTQVLPYAAPGILTGTLLSLARALGEAAPLILVGAVQERLGPQTGFFGLSQLGEQFTAMPIFITNAAKTPGDDWVEVTAAAIVVLLVVVLVANTGAILLRNRFEKKRGS
jgi:phosphate transport system permease protein